MAPRTPENNIGQSSIEEALHELRNSNVGLSPSRLESLVNTEIANRISLESSVKSEYQKARLNLRGTLDNLSNTLYSKRVNVLFSSAAEKRQFDEPMYNAMRAALYMHLKREATKQKVKTHPIKNILLWSDKAKIEVQEFNERTVDNLFAVAVPGLLSEKSEVSTQLGNLTYQQLFQFVDAEIRFCKSQEAMFRLGIGGKGVSLTEKEARANELSDIVKGLIDMRNVLTPLKNREVLMERNKLSALRDNAHKEDEQEADKLLDDQLFA